MLRDLKILLRIAFHREMVTEAEPAREARWLGVRM